MPNLRFTMSDRFSTGQWRELGLAIVEVGNYQAQTVVQMQENCADFEVEVAELGGQPDVLGNLGRRQFVRTRTPVNYSHWNALAERWMLGGEVNDDAGYWNRFRTVI